VYIYQSKKKNSRVHMLTLEGTTYCKIENSAAALKLNTRSEELPEGRLLCSTCESRKQKTGGYRPEWPRRVFGDFLTSIEWRTLRLQAFQRYGRRCMCCGATQKQAMLCVDHVKPRKHYPELALDIDNLQILCEPCNHGKGNSDDPESDFRVEHNLRLHDVVDWLGRCGCDPWDDHLWPAAYEVCQILIERAKEELE